MSKYNMDGISDAYFSSDKQYKDYTKNVSGPKKQNPPKQVAVKKTDKRTSTAAGSHSGRNDSNDRSKGQYEKILGISDPAFSGGDEFATYGEYLRRRAEENEKPANDHSAVEATVRMKFDDGSMAGARELGNALPSRFPGAKDFTMPGSQKNAMPFPQVVPVWKQYADTMADGFGQTNSKSAIRTYDFTAGNQIPNTLPSGKSNSQVKLLSGTKDKTTSAKPLPNMAQQQHDNSATEYGAVIDAIDDLRNQVKRSSLPLRQAQQIDTYLNAIENTSKYNPAAAYTALQNMQALGFENIGKHGLVHPALFPLDELRNDLNDLNDELAELQQKAMDVLKDQRRNGQYSGDAYKELGERQRELVADINEKKQQIDYRKYVDMINAEIKTPFFSGSPNSTIWEPVAERITELYKPIWYNLDEEKTDELFEQLYPMLSDVSFYNIKISTAYEKQKQANNPELWFEEHNSLSYYEHNGLGFITELDSKTKEYKKYIVSQGNLKRIGYSAGNTPDNGCGWVATYNALEMLGANPKPYETMREMEDGALLLGAMGTDPLFIQQYFQKKGYDARLYFTKEDIEREAPRSKANIWIYGWYNYDVNTKKDSIGAHYVACGHEKGKQVMTFYNGDLSNQGTPYKYIGPLDDYYQSSDLFRMMICIN